MNNLPAYVEHAAKDLWFSRQYAIRTDLRTDYMKRLEAAIVELDEIKRFLTVKA